MLSAAQIEARKGKLTASRVGVLMTGDAEGVRRLWLEMIGDPDFVPDDLSKNWAVQLGAATERLHLDWYEMKHGPVSRRGEVVSHPVLNWAACTLDGWDDVKNCPIEAKHVGGFEHLDRVIGRYQPQMQWTMICTNADECALSVIVGAQEPIREIIERDEAYCQVLRDRTMYFMRCVAELRDPVPDLPPLPPPVIPVRHYDMSGNNRWASNAVTWLDTRGDHKRYETAARELRRLVPADASICSGHGVEARRARDGSVRFRESE